MREFLETLVCQLENGVPCVLTTAIERTGSVPTPAGSQLLVSADSVWGTIGGGQVEAEMVLRSRSILTGSVSCLSSFSFDSDQVRPENMLCGGRVTFYSELLQPGHADLEFWSAALERIRSGGNAVFVTAVSESSTSEGRRSHLLLDGTERLAGGLPERASEQAIIREVKRYAVDGFDPVYLTVEHSSKNHGDLSGLLIEYVHPVPTVVIYGGGHVGLALSRSASAAGFRVTVVDDRVEYTRAGRFPEGTNVIHCRFEEAFDKLAPGPGDYLVSVTRCHDQDRVVISRAVNYPAAYIGMIGSRRKVKVLWEHLRERGVDPERLARVHAPVGLEIGAETPEEIAVSITAQLIQVRRSRKPAIRQGRIVL